MKLNLVKSYWKCQLCNRKIYQYNDVWNIFLRHPWPNRPLISCFIITHHFILLPYQQELSRTGLTILFKIFRFHLGSSLKLCIVSVDTQLDTLAPLPPSSNHGIKLHQVIFQAKLNKSVYRA